MVVTGSHIHQPNLESVSPITQMDASAFENRGAERIEDLLNRLPQVQSSLGVNVTNRGQVGTSSVDLRGLGPTRTLVLLNGRRLPYGSPKVVPADLNLIPDALIKNVEVLTGGASAVYGSDALAGVVNFNLIDDFEGFRINAGTSAFEHHNGNDAMQAAVKSFNAADPGQYPLPASTVLDGVTQNYSMVMGKNFDDKRGNVTLYAGFRKFNEVDAQDRDFSSCRLGAAAGGHSYTCNPSPISTLASFVNTGAAGLPATFRVLNNQFVAGNPPVAGFNDIVGGQLQAPDRRFNLGAMGHYEISNRLIPYVEFQYTNSTTDSIQSPGAVQRNGISNATGGINCDNPYLTAQEADFLCTGRGLSTASNYDPVTGAYISPASVATGVLLNKRTPEDGFRDELVKLNTFRLVGGLKGDLFGPFRYDLSATYANVNQSRLLTGLPSQVRAPTAIFAVIDHRVNSNGTPFASTYGQPVCEINADASPYNDDPNCSPVNYFSGSGPSAAGAAYVGSTKVATGDTSLTDLLLSIDGDLGAYGVQSPFARHGVAVAFGSEYRENTLDNNPDAEYIAFNEDFPVHGKQSVAEAFTEMTLPLVEDKPFLQQLSVEGAFRYSRYQGGMDTTTHKLGLNWAPLNGFRLRGSYQRAVRAPNLNELFQPQLRQQNIQLPQNPNGSYDPCSGATPFATFAQCARTGVTAAEYGHVADYNFFGQLLGGNPNLKPETGRTLTVGAVLEPEFLPGFTASADYYRIEVSDLIGTVDPVLALNQCLNTGDNYFCSLLHRGVGGTLHATQDAYFISTNVNTGSLKTTGVDVALNYRTPLHFKRDWGSVNLNLNGTYLDSYITKPLPTSTAAQTYDCAGYYGFQCGAPHPKWRHVFTSTWETPWPVALTATWRFIDEVKISRASSQSTLQGTYNQIDYKLPTQNYIDLSATWRASSQLTLRAGVNNVLDHSPPLTSQSQYQYGGNLNTYPGFYDALGRYLFLSAQIDF